MEQKYYKDDSSTDFKDTVFKSFSPENMFEYELNEINEEEEKMFCNYLSKFFNNKTNYFLYYRGDNFEKYGEREFEKILKKQLGKFFIVGFKGENYFQQHKKPRKHRITFKELINYSEDLLEIIKKKIPSFKEGSLSKGTEKRIEEIFAIIHNNEEKFPEEKKNSPLVSITVGNDNFEIAKYFSNYYDRKKGFIVMGFEEKDGLFIDSNEIRKFNTQLQDIIDGEQEIMVKDVLWPDKVLGVFVLNRERKDFIINPWLIYKMKSQDIENMKDPFIYVDQKDFDTLYKELGYSSYIMKQTENFDEVGISDWASNK